jgi:Zn-dependent peptidase ImmA (M78 family)
MKRANSHRTDRYPKKLQARIKLEAQKLIAHVGEGGPPYDPYLIAQNMDVEVIEKPLTGYDGYVQCNEGRYVVTIARDTVIQRQRFTLAHELCHVWLMRQADDGYPAPLIRYRNTQNLPGLHQDPVEEYLCNFFAGELLIPSGELQARFENKVVGPTSVFKLANEFCVSPQTAAIQLYNSLPSRLVACSLWSLESLWPLPIWWIGVKTPYKDELRLIEELVGSRSPEMEMWSGYGRKKLKVIIEMAPRTRVTMVTIRHFRS